MALDGTRNELGWLFLSEVEWIAANYFVIRLLTENHNKPAAQVRDQTHQGDHQRAPHVPRGFDSA